MREPIARVSVTAAAEAMKKGGVQIIDVREPFEFESERIADARLIPLGQVENECERISRFSGSTFIVCRSGGRALKAAEILQGRGVPNVAIVDGGILAWNEAGLLLVRGSRKLWSLERQVRFAAGLLVLVGIVSMLFVHPGFLALSAFVAVGLIFSALTDTCGMAAILSRMPWNPKPKEPTNCDPRRKDE